MRLRLHNARIWDGASDAYSDARELLVEDETITSLGEGGDADRVIDCGGRALLPGFIDAHFHAYAARVDIPYAETLPITYLAHHASIMLGAALRRGFTTIRDAGGADWGLWRAAEDRMFASPRIFYAGKAISQTGGHGDSRAQHVEPCGCRYVANLSQVADGADEMRRVVREAFRRGAHHIKLFVGGGVISPTDPIHMKQYSEEEIRVAVEEASARNSYVMAHAYVPKAIIPAVRAGVRSIEHGNLLDIEAAEAMAECGAFLVPTLVTYSAMAEEGDRFGLPEVSRTKLHQVVEHGGEAVRLARAAGVRVGFGTDLLGQLHDWQAQEFRLRGAIEEPIAVLRSATSENAALMQQTGRLGCIAPGALADLVLFDGDPLSDLSVLWEREPALVVKGGTIALERLT
jgi:imidazolonepropionase-like amidohydrolase